MSSILSNANQFLPAARSFSKEPEKLVEELTKAYSDIASNVNARTVGSYASFPSATGDSWFLDGLSRKQASRKIIPITGTGNTAHGIEVANIYAFTKIYGSFTDGTYWYPLPYLNVTGIGNGVALKISSTDVIVTAGSGSPPTFSRGIVTLEWI